MSGVEVVGIGLAILPLLISAAEHYADCIRPILRYRKLVAEIHHFQQNLEVQKTIFRNQCRILLEGAIEHDAAVRMLDVGSDDPSWIDHELEERLTKQLGHSKKACLISIELIDEKLRIIEKESLDMLASVDEAQPLKRRIAKKMRFSLSQSRLDEYIRSLRDLNDDFTKLSSQTTQVAAHRTRMLKAHHYKNEKELSRYKAVGEASEKIYEALCRACTKHSEHLAYFCINPVTESAHTMTTAHYKFHIAFTRLPLMPGLEHTSRSEDTVPIWFMIDTVTDQDSSERSIIQPRGQRTHGSFVDTLKRELEAPMENMPMPKKSHKIVRFQTPQAEQSVIPPTISSMPAIPKFRKDFCNMLRNHLGSPCSPTSCIGLLENDGCSKHRVYAPSEEVLSHGRSQTTLLDVLTSSRLQSSLFSRLPICERLHLAKDLAVAVLQYHATPWLGISWRSRDLYLYVKNDEKDKSKNVNLSSLHVNAKVKDSRMDPKNVPSQISTLSLAPNNLLFSLGATLLELGYSSDLCSLQKPCDTEYGRDSQYIEFFIAQRLASNAIREMGGTYSRIVKKLLQCNFGCGDDLNDHDLQSLIYKDVICELDKLESKFRELELG